MKRKFLFVLLSLCLSCPGQQTWHEIKNALPANYFPVDFARAPNDDIYLICYKPEGALNAPKLLVSDNNGRAWSEVIVNGLPKNKPISVCFTGTKLLIVLSGVPSYVMYSSSNFGLNWTAANMGFASGTHQGHLARKSNDNVYLSAWYQGSQNTPKLYKSGNLGGSWTEVITSGLYPMKYPQALAVNWNGTMVMDISTDAFGGGSKAYYSSDGGVSWTASSGGPSFTGSEFAVNALGTVYWMGYDSTGVSLYSSQDDGVTWQKVNAGGLSLLGKVTSMIQTNGPMLACGTSTATGSPGKLISTDIFLDVNESAGRTVRVFPNPASDFVYFESDFMDREGTMEIISSCGELVRTCDYCAGPIDVRDLRPGIYYVRIVNGNSRKGARLVRR